MRLFDLLKTKPLHASNHTDHYQWRAGYNSYQNGGRNLTDSDQFISTPFIYGRYQVNCLS